jgi:RNA recognition motif-containing protein
MNAIGLNSATLQIPNNLMQNTNTQSIQNNIGQSGVFPLNYNANNLDADTPYFNNEKIESEQNSTTDNTALSHSNFNSHNIPHENIYEKPNQEGEMDRPWDRASKDPSIIQRGTELFVGNLSLDTTENDLYEAFMDCGEVIDVNI